MTEPLYLNFKTHMPSVVKTHFITNWQTPYIGRFCNDLLHYSKQHCLVIINVAGGNLINVFATHNYAALMFRQEITNFPERESYID
jgi:hypothetical protein